LPLELFGLRHWQLQSDGEIVGKVRSADIDGRRLSYSALKEDGDVG